MGQAGFRQGLRRDPPTVHQVIHAIRRLDRRGWAAVEPFAVECGTVANAVVSLFGGPEGIAHLAGARRGTLGRARAAWRLLAALLDRDAGEDEFMEAAACNAQFRALLDCAARRECYHGAAIFPLLEGDYAKLAAVRGRLAGSRSAPAEGLPMAAGDPESMRRETGQCGQPGTAAEAALGRQQTAAAARIAASVTALTGDGQMRRVCEMLVSSMPVEREAVGMLDPALAVRARVWNGTRAVMAAAGIAAARPACVAVPDWKVAAGVSGGILASRQGTRLAPDAHPSGASGVASADAVRLAPRRNTITPALADSRLDAFVRQAAAEARSPLAVPVLRLAVMAVMCSALARRHLERGRTASLERILVLREAALRVLARQPWTTVRYAPAARHGIAVSLCGKHAAEFAGAWRSEGWAEREWIWDNRGRLRGCGSCGYSEDPDADSLYEVALEIGGARFRWHVPHSLGRGWLPPRENLGRVVLAADAGEEFVLRQGNADGIADPAWTEARLRREIGILTGLFSKRA